MDESDIQKSLSDPYVRDQLRRARKLMKMRSRGNGLGRQRRTLVHPGERFGQLTVVSYNKFSRFAICCCDCGTHTSILAPRLKIGGATSCGCKRARNARP